MRALQDPDADTGKNRNKTQLDVDARLLIVDAHAVYDDHNIRLRALYLHGKLGDAEDVALANKGLPRSLEAKKSPVASEAVAYFVEAGYDIAALFDYQKAIVPFFKFDFVDSMHETEGSIPDLDRYERTLMTVGIDYFYNPSVVYKADYARNSNGDKNIEDLNSFNLSAGYQF